MLALKRGRSLAAMFGAEPVKNVAAPSLSFGCQGCREGDGPEISDDQGVDGAPVRCGWRQSLAAAALDSAPPGTHAINSSEPGRPGNGTLLLPSPPEIAPYLTANVAIFVDVAEQELGHSGFTVAASAGASVSRRLPHKVLMGLLSGCRWRPRSI